VFCDEVWIFPLEPQSLKSWNYSALIPYCVYSFQTSHPQTLEFSNYVRIHAELVKSLSLLSEQATNRYMRSFAT
jgi:hypothetical protein